MAVSRHTHTLVIAGTDAPVTVDGTRADLGFRFRVQGSNSIELLDGVLCALRSIGLTDTAIAAGLQYHLSRISAPANGHE